VTRHAQKCPKQLGTLAVVVVRGDTGEPIKGATAAVKGPTAGSGKTAPCRKYKWTQRG